MPTRPLRDSAHVTLDGTGAGTVRLGPGRPGVRWLIRRISVQTSSASSIPVAKIYRGGVGDASFISGTFVGSQDTDDGLDEELNAGEYLTVAWTGGDAGATATATYAGDESTGGA